MPDPRPICPICNRRYDLVGIGDERCPTCSLEGLLRALERDPRMRNPEERDA